MNARDAYARLLGLAMPVIGTSDVAAALRCSPDAATLQLTRLAQAGLVSRIRRGLWHIGTTPPDRYVLVEGLTAPMPSYISLQTALYLHGLIEQVASVIYVVTLGETRRIETSVGDYSLHHITPELFDGFDTKRDGPTVASPEKSVFDMAYFSGAKSRLFARVPELEIPTTFRHRKLQRWVDKIVSPRRRSMVRRRLDSMLLAAED